MKRVALQADGLDAVFSVWMADSFLTRFCGLMMRRSLPEKQGLLLVPCSSIHMCFMRFSIDVIYLDKQGRIVKVVRNLHPWIGLSLCFGAHAAIEFKAGTADRLGLKCGQVLRRRVSI